ncbi:tetratricopeptide repeat protein [Catenovulum sediminis]|uniref:Sel1 repeat family protein n=1 Tax=Catenovulum sediminis TaxID=1740262 RepID=A0ABV1RCY8_9ALTE
MNLKSFYQNNSRIKLAILSVALILSGQNQASIFAADEFFKNKDYNNAKSEYLKSAELGSPKAYYQLGTLYLKGLTGPASYLDALVWFSLAAEYQFNDAEQVVTQLLALLPEAQQSDIQNVLATFKEKYGKQIVEQKYFPEFKYENIAHTISFGDAEGPDATLVTHDEIFTPIHEEISFEYTTEELGGFEDDFGVQSNDWQSENTNPQPDFFNRPYLLIADYDLAPDGTARNVEPVQTIGYTRRAMESLRQMETALPEFNGQPVYFVNRINMGMASYSKFEMADKNQALYDRIRRMARKLKKSNELEDRYQYAMALKNFSWLPQAQNEAEHLLKRVAEDGHPIAQYEYGLLLYREQSDIKQGINWIASASKFGLTKAEYRLGHILQLSPWVVNDEAKALYWYLSAAEKNYKPALLKAAELKLVAKDKTLIDLAGATQLLERVGPKKEEEPEYHYLLSLTKLSGPNRNLKVAFQSMRKAIDLAESYNWDVSAWQSQLDEWTRGTVRITNESVY